MFCFIFLLGHKILGTELMVGLCIFSLKGSFNISKVPTAILSNVKWNLMCMCFSSVCNFLKESIIQGTTVTLHYDAYCNSEINRK